MSNLTDFLAESSIDPGSACPSCGAAFTSTCARCAKAQAARVVAELLIEHDAEVRYRAIRDVARKIHNGAPDREQELYDKSVAPWLEQQAFEGLLNTPGVSLEFVREAMFA